MKALMCRRWEPQRDDCPSCAMRARDVRIRVRAAGFNFAYGLMVGGSTRWVVISVHAGLKAAGEVIETGGGVTALPTGQRVLAVLRNGGGHAFWAHPLETARG